MFNSRFFISLLVVLIVNVVVSFVFRILIPNYYIAQLCTSIFMAFFFAVLNEWFDRKHFYKHLSFWYTFFITGIVFVLFDLLWYLI